MQKSQKESFAISNGNWEAVPKELSQERNWSPNRLYWDEKNRRMQIQIQQGEFGDFALNLPALVDSIEAEDKGRISKAYVVLIDRETRTIMAIETVKNVARNLNGIQPLKTSDKAPYYWITDDFMPAKKASASMVPPWER